MSTPRYIYTFYTDPPRAFPEAAVPEAAVPEAAVPEAAVPKAAVPKAAVPEAAAAEAKLGDAINHWLRTLDTMDTDECQMKLVSIMVAMRKVVGQEETKAITKAMIRAAGAKHGLIDLFDGDFSASAASAASEAELIEAEVSPEAELSPEVEPESRSHWDLHWKTLRQHTEIKRYERKRARLLKNADSDELARAYEKRPKLYADLKRKLAKHMDTDQKKYLKYLKTEYFLLKKALSRARE